MQGETDGETVPRDQPGTVTWMSYAELGRLRGTSAASAKRFANRKHWRKQPGNDGTVRVAVPPGGTVPRETSRATPGETVPGDQPRDRGWDRGRDHDLLPGALASLEAALTEATRRADSAFSLAEGTMAQLAGANARADRAEGRVTALQTGLDVARAEARAAQDAAEELRRQIEAGKARGLLARLRAAVRGR
jgi:hypothetical protein